MELVETLGALEVDANVVVVVEEIITAEVEAGELEVVVMGVVEVVVVVVELEDDVVVVVEVVVVVVVGGTVVEVVVVALGQIGQVPSKAST